jgi:hypothetical protein
MKVIPLFLERKFIMRISNKKKIKGVMVHYNEPKNIARKWQYPRYSLISPEARKMLKKSFEYSKLTLSEMEKCLKIKREFLEFIIFNDTEENFIIPHVFYRRLKFFAVGVYSSGVKKGYNSYKPILRPLLRVLKIYSKEFGEDGKNVCLSIESKSKRFKE